MRRWFNSIHAQHFSGKQPIFQQDVESKYSPVPYKGWDAVSPLSAMEPEYAVILDNCVPRPGWIEVRGGAIEWANIGDPIETLMVYRPDNDTEEMFAASSDTIYDVSVISTVTAVVTALGSGRWQYINFTPAGAATRLVAVNGVDAGKIYNGTSWTDFSVTGFSTTSAINIWAHKRRIWLVEENSSTVYYLPTDAITGTVGSLELGSFLHKGSNIVAMSSWTIDGGNGPDDYAVFVSNKGQAVLYKGTDPDNPNAWFLVGVFDLPSPIGNRCMLKYGSDILYICLEGLIPLSKALPFDPSGARSVALTNRIQNAMSSAANLYRENFGWETKLFPAQTLLVMNVPTTELSESHQFVMNTLTGAWCRFTNWNANVFEIFNESLYYGDGAGNIALAYVGGNDLGNPIPVDIKCAYNYYDDPGRLKVVQMARPYIVSNGNVTVSIGIDVDFGEADLVGAVTSPGIPGGIWDQSLWDDGVWGGGLVTINSWYTVVAIGTALAIRLKSNIFTDNGDVTFSKSGQLIPTIQFNQFQLILEHGAPVG